MTASDIPSLERPVFFDGQRLTPDDLAAVQAFDRELRWLHNRSLHGWGVARGLTVSGVRGADSVDVAPGYALDCLGREPSSPIGCRCPFLLSPRARAGTSRSRIARTTSRRPSCAPGRATRAVRSRLPDAPSVAFRTKRRLGIDVVLARITVEGCVLRSLSLAERNELHPPSPYIGAGRTPAGATEWRGWPNDDDPLGVATTVETTTAGFRATPRYQANVVGDRLRADGTLVDGYAHVASPAATSFDVVVPLVSGQLVAASSGTVVPLNPPGALGAQLLLELRDALQWHVAWIGVEA